MFALFFLVHAKAQKIVIITTSINNSIHGTLNMEAGMTEGNFSVYCYIFIISALVWKEHWTVRPKV